MACLCLMDHTDSGVHRDIKLTLLSVKTNIK